MPSPIAHSLIGLSLGIAVLRPPGESLDRTLRTRAAPLLGVVALANAPDLDFLPGLLVGELNRFHHGPSHSALGAMMVGLVVGAVLFRRGLPIRWPVLLLLAAAVLSHLAADILCQDRSPPFGIPLWWPLSETRVHAPWSLFLAMEKSTLGEVFSNPSNLRPALRELAIGGAVLVLALAWTARRRRDGSPA